MPETVCITCAREIQSTSPGFTVMFMELFSVCELDQVWLYVAVTLRSMRPAIFPSAVTETPAESVEPTVSAQPIDCVASEVL
ncbi:hypothetical protein [Streptomyces inhibens]|uniref:hypothetical protein n=1 Tax=Streptomyces inhibens TaxID=2293571 RepID=UPI0015F25966|nr:hypothetical protein [Streptomyces inhibens]